MLLERGDFAIDNLNDNLELGDKNNANHCPKFNEASKILPLKNFSIDDKLII